MLEIKEPVDGIRDVLFNHETIGVITSSNEQVFVWTPLDPMPFNMNIAPEHSFQLEPVIDLLKDCTERQYKAFKTGATPDHNTLHPELRPFLSDGPIGLKLAHPLLYEIFYTPNMNARYNYSLKLKKEMTAKAIEEKNYHRYVRLHERPWRLWAFDHIRHHLQPTDFWEMVSSIWTDSENIWQNMEEWEEIWNVDIPSRQNVMDQSERRHLAKLPEKITVYRGVSNRRSIKGFSWTLDRDKGIWFAQRYARTSDTPLLAKMTIKKSKILAYFDGRNEREVILLPKDCRMITTTPINGR